MLHAMIAALLLAMVATTVVAAPPPTELTFPRSSIVYHEEPQDDKCCFALKAVHIMDTGEVKDVGIVKQSTIGELRIGGPFQQGFFCVNPDDGAIKDGRDNTCFINQETQHFQCFRGLHGTNLFKFKELDLPNGAVVPLLTQDGNESFFMCPTTRGVDPVSSTYNIFSASMPQRIDCTQIVLFQHQQTPDVCHIDHDDHFLKFLHKRRYSLSQEHFCKAFSGNSPLSPLIFPKNSAEVNWQYDSGFVTMPNPTNALNLHLEFHIPASYVPAVADSAPGRMCALQFRMPVCPEAPAGYPCVGEKDTFYMLVRLSKDSHASYNGSKMRIHHTIRPGEKVTLFQFSCDVDIKKKNREITWHVIGGHFKSRSPETTMGYDVLFDDEKGDWARNAFFVEACE
ncbi:uncharacterized protein CTRU02_200732 [Colletotrichum truncatum]|uniref:Uncharacterized protein n=1 Tax=Colletotrichum truncatum TaxID=5467 RepID=A0ACC3ZFE8_COLTU|nr:uncharacterized protein CTRU02_00496 [Colletotrichum truncatum]KAF6801747.1 hypothetical protein CTRU02_00496 [Colletotrichum truncatum]